VGGWPGLEPIHIRGRDCPTASTTLDELLPCEGLDESAGVDDAKVKHAIPRPLQAEAYGAWVGAGFGGTIMAPTGTGKTTIEGYAIKMLDEPALIICPAERILKMWGEGLWERLGISATAYYGGEKRIGRVTVSIYNAVAIHDPELVEAFRLIILDEAHHVASEAFQRVLRMIRPEHEIMALTATLRREDDGHEQTKAILPVVYCLDLAEAVRRGLVAPVKVIPMRAEAILNGLVRPY